MKLYFLLFLLAMALAPSTGVDSVEYGLRYRKLHSQKAVASVGTGRKLTGCGMSGGKAGRYRVDECEDDYYVEEVVEDDDKPEQPGCAPVSAPVKAPTDSIDVPTTEPVSAPVSPPLKAPVASPVSPPQGNADDDTISNDPINAVDRQGDDDGPGIPGLPGLDDDEPDAQHVPSNDDPKAL
jgi:hypothetical protein